MAELVDALVSGTSVRKYVQVRVLFWAQEKVKILLTTGKGKTPVCDKGIIYTGPRW